MNIISHECLLAYLEDNRRMGGEPIMYLVRHSVRAGAHLRGSSMGCHAHPVHPAVLPGC